MSNLHRQMIKKSAPPMPNLPFGRHRSKRNQKHDYKPTQWNEFFEEKHDFEVDQHRKFRVYLTKKTEKPGPVLLLLHGGGYSGLTWAHFSLEITHIIHCQCLAIDLRGHGDTMTDNDDDLSTDTLCLDICDLILKIFPNEVPPLYIIGHSMGGALAVHFAHKSLVSSIVGITVIDVVEGTAMEALSSMQRFLHSRPSFFKSIPNAIEWCVRSGQVRNVESAKVSIPGQIINCMTKLPATNELPLDDVAETTPSDDKSTSTVYPFSIAESDEENGSGADGHATVAQPISLPPSSENIAFRKPFEINPAEPNSTTLGYTWRIDLSKSEKHWVGWFSGLSERFLNLRIPKQLILASIDGLDKALTVGQMQGRFQMQVLARCGHAVHEDRPLEVAEAISSYMIKNRLVEAMGEVRCQLPSC